MYCVNHNEEPEEYVRAAKKTSGTVVSVKSGSTSQKKCSLQEIDHSYPLLYLRQTNTSSRLLTTTEERELSKGIQDWEYLNNIKCRSVIFALDWGKSHQKKVLVSVIVAFVDWLLACYKHRWLGECLLQTFDERLVLSVIYGQVFAIIPDLEAVRRRSTSGIQALCSLHIALRKTKNVLQHWTDYFYDAYILLNG